MYKRHKFLSHSSMLFTMNLAANILHIMGDTGNIWSIFCHVEKEYDKVWIQIDANDEPKLKLFRMAHVCDDDLFVIRKLGISTIACLNFI